MVNWKLIVNFLLTVTVTVVVVVVVVAVVIAVVEATLKLMPAARDPSRAHPHRNIQW